MIKPRFLRYDLGGGFDPFSMGMQGAQMVSQTLTGITDAVAPVNEYGNQSAKIMGLKGVFNGGLVGGAFGYFQGKHQEHADEQRRFQDKIYDANYQANRTAAQLTSDPDSFYGRGNILYRNGGQMRPVYMADGGSLKPLSSNSSEVIGPSHEQGGVNLPAAAANVEGKETIADGFVFSKELGFAQMHKPIAKAIGKIEVKPMTMERLNSMRALKEREQSLARGQEILKKVLNIK